MEKKKAFKALLLSASLVCLTACSESEDDDPNPVVDNSTGNTDMSGNTDGSDGADNVAPPSGGSFLNNDRPQFVTGLCDSQPISDAQQSNDPAAPTNMIPGQIVSGRIDPSSATNIEHFWSITLAAGFYHIVLESDRVDSANSNLGLILTDLNGFAAEDDVDLLASNESGYRARNHEFIEILEARTIVLKVTPRFTGEDYTFGIFENGSAVPSPYYTDCPTITTLSLNTTEALTLPLVSSADDDRWYLVDLAASDYIIKSTAARTDGNNSNLIYEFGQIDQFGQNDRYVTVSRVNEVGTNTTGLGALTRTEPGPVWVRLRNLNAELSMEFTVEPDI